MKQVNGVDIEKLSETMNAIRGNPDIAKFNFRATNKWLEGGHNRTTINEFDGACSMHNRAISFVIDEDEPPVLLGQDKGANPVEYALTALAGCLTTSLVYHASARGIKIDEVESTLEGNLDIRGFLGLSEGIRNGYDGIQVTFKIKSDAPKEQLQELVDIAKKRSPVFDIVSNPTPISVRLDN
ncbi:MAG: OsmC family protein [Candidatus Nitrosotenuis sp.]|uniref:OsmC family protein n=1 Tax=Candidatus Nitrosotenuis uzonensis TaxID=1407055 RepID=A0A812F049_9ARCH|nr:OsmC family protein [Candidatus Nitrosotenuis uzonensis]MCA2003828.1 OsmC family protein [Candidatus Nitrosotenuis sp.]CAE6484166.1 conserved hypothetical protein [Candidatus Nitrosotenuis uzonensis]